MQTEVDKVTQHPCVPEKSGVHPTPERERDVGLDPCFPARLPRKVGIILVPFGLTRRDLRGRLESTGSKACTMRRSLMHWSTLCRAEVERRFVVFLL